MRPDTNLETDVLAAVVENPERYARLLFQHLEEDDFTSPENKVLFRAISAVAKRDGNEAIAPATVREELRRHDADEKDVLRLLDPAMGAGPIGSFEPKCRRLRELHQARFVDEEVQRVMQGATDPQEALEGLRALMERAMMMAPRKMRSFGDLLDDMVGEIEYDMQHQDARIRTGLPTLDRYLRGGFSSGWLVVLGARTGMGKTMFATQITAKACASGQKVLYFTMEEAATQISQRVVRSYRKLPNSLRADDVQPLITAAFDEDVRNLPLAVAREARLDAIVGMTGEHVMAQEGVSLVVVDYAGLVNAGRFESKVQEISEVTKVLKNAAMEYGVPILLLAQVNRQPASRADSKPTLTDLRDSGSLEQDADAVIFLHHREDNVAEDVLRLAKNRYGPPGDLPVRYDYAYGRVEELVMTP